MPITNNILAGSGQGSADLGAPIDQSLRFTSSGSSQKLQSSSSLATDHTEATCSFWFKFSNVSQTALAGLVSCAGGVNVVTSFDGRTTRNRLFNGGAHTTEFYEDPTAWYHIVHIYGRKAAGANTVSHETFINGKLVLDTTAGSVSGQSDNFRIGEVPGHGTGFQGYIAEFNYLDGTAIGLTADGNPDEFGRYNEDGVWVPKAISFTSDQYGAKGFRLTFASDQHATASTAIGIDSAPTGGNHASANNFTATGFDTAAISSTNRLNDIDIADTPTSNYPTFNLLWYRTTPSLKGANMELNTSTTITGQATFRFPVGTTGKYWVEAGTASFGATTNPPALLLTSELDAAGLSNTSWSTAANYSGIGGHLSAFYTNFNSTTANSFTMSTGQVALGINFDDQEVLMYNGGTLINTDTTVDFTKELALNVQQPDSSYNTYDPYLNAGQQTHIQSPPAGYKALQTNNLPEPTIKNGSDHFRALTGTGANIFGIATGTNTNGTNWNDDVNTGFTSGLWWIKNKDGSNEHQVIDIVRGTSNVLTSPTNSTHTTYSAPSNDSVAWCWKAEDTWSSTDANVTAGTIASSGRRNLDAGFSIVSYSGSGAVGTVGHALGQKPDFIITKRLNDSGNYWVYWHAGLGVDQGYGYLNFALDQQTSATMWTGIGTDTWTYDANSNVNDSSGTYISYAWHSVPGYSKFGSYEGTGTSNGAYVYLGFKPALIMLKNADTANQWGFWDSTRDPNNNSDEHSLTPLSTVSETGGYIIDFLSNGFKCRDSSGDTNSASTFTYCAWAENPFGGENAPPATAR
jgi:hypothetical protein